MTNLTPDQCAGSERLQSRSSADVSPEGRQKIICAIVSVPKEELDTTPEPPKEKRGRRPSIKTL